MESHSCERSSVLSGWRGTLSDVAELAGRVGEVLGGGAVASLVITEKDGQRLEFSGPNQLRAIAATISPRRVASIEIQGEGGQRGDVGANELISLRASGANQRWRSGGIALLVIASPRRAERIRADVERAVRRRVPARRLAWMGRAAGRAPFALLAERRRSRPTRLGRAVEAGADVIFEALSAAVIAVIVLVVARLL